MIRNKKHGISGNLTDTKPGLFSCESNPGENVTEQTDVMELAEDDLAQAVGGSGDVSPYRNETNIEASVAGRTVF